MILGRGALVDCYVEDERSVVMVNERVLVLSPVATEILEAVPDGELVPIAAVVAHVVAAFGPPAGTQSADSITRGQVRDLTAYGVLVAHVGQTWRRDDAPGSTRPVERDGVDRGRDATDLSV